MTNSSTRWHMLTLVGEDRPGIVAALARALYSGKCNLGETSMMRLGGNFTIMMMVAGAQSSDALAALVSPVADSLGLRLHVDAIEGRLHQHLAPDAQVTVHGADRAGIVAEVTGALADAGFHILDLNSDVGGTDAAPVYLMMIEGHAANGLDELEAALAPLRDKGIELVLEPIDTLMG